MENALRHLTADDRRLLMAKAVVARYPKGDTIIEENSRRQKIHILQTGFVSVRRAHLGQGVSVARLGPGEVFGEMSFLENSGASASVVADDDTVEVAEIAGEDVHALLASVPGFATRFYQSLAITLSHRLRDSSAQLPPLLVEEVPQVNRFHSTRTGNGGGRDVPPSLVEAVEQFKTSMMLADRAICARKLESAEAAIKVAQTCTAMEDALRLHVEREKHLAKAIGSYVFRETFPLFMLSRMVDRTFSKPRGYAGDYYTIELMYRDEPQGDGRLGRYVDGWSLDLPASRAVKNRRPLLVTELAAAAERWSSSAPMRVTSLASGPARELFDFLERVPRPLIHATCIDIDLEALEFANATARDAGLEGNFTFAQDNVLRLAKGRGKVTIPPQSLVYSIGLIDYLQDEYVVTLINWIFDNLITGGGVILGNFDVSNPTKAYMDHVLEWVLIHRSADHLRELFARSKFCNAPVDVRKESAGVNLFAFCTKP